MRSHSIIAAVGLGWMTLFGCATARAQFQIPQDALSFEDDGKLEELEESVIKIRDSKTEAWYLQIDSNTKVTVKGEAEEEYLHPGLAVQIEGEIDKKNTLSKAVTEIEIFTPHGKSPFGLFSPAKGGADTEDAKPIRNPGPGTYRIRGKLAMFRDGELAVMVGGRRVTGDIANKLTIKVNMDDLSVVSPGDDVHVKARYTDQTKPILNRPGRGVADEVTVTLDKPLAPSGKKTRSAADKAAKPAKTTRPTKG